MKKWFLNDELYDPDEVIEFIVKNNLLFEEFKITETDHDSIKIWYYREKEIVDKIKEPIRPPARLLKKGGVDPDAPWLVILSVTCALILVGMFVWVMLGNYIM